MNRPTIQQKAQNIRLLALDVDGVLTDGGVYVFEDGTEFRRFNIKDGLGLRRVLETGIQVAIISASVNQAIVNRAEKLGISEVFLGSRNKVETLQHLCQRLNLSLEQVAYIGDDLTDLPVLKQVGLPCAPNDAVDEVKNSALLITTRDGGQGAVREVCDWLVPFEDGEKQR